MRLSAPHSPAMTLSPTTEIIADLKAGQMVILVDVLMVPLKPLCQEDCRGLCPICGANLNRETCSCQAEKSDSPFAALAKLKV